MDILSFDQFTIPNRLDLSAIALLDEAYGQDDGGENGRADDETVDRAPETYRAFLTVDPTGDVIGHLAAYVRQVDQDGTALTLGLIGNVATRKTHRRRGIAKALVTASHAYFRGAGAPFSMLFAYDPPVYVSSGYRLSRDELTFLGRDGHPTTAVLPGTMICELTPQPWQAGPINLNGPPV